MECAIVHTQVNVDTFLSLYLRNFYKELVAPCYVLMVTVALLEMAVVAGLAARLNKGTS
eukprot:SAG31_NODE_1760_length_7322_cov_2.480011_3_plen_59_part_00